MAKPTPTSRYIGLMKQADADRAASWEKANKGDWEGFVGLRDCALSAEAEARQLAIRAAARTTFGRS